MAEKQLTSTKDLKRVLGFWDLMAIGVGSIIGSGIMSLTGLGIERTGRAIFIAFIIGGYCLAGALPPNFPELGGPLQRRRLLHGQYVSGSTLERYLFHDCGAYQRHAGHVCPVVR